LISEPFGGGDVAAPTLNLEAQDDFADAVNQRAGGDPRHQKHHRYVP
jgi:hypothetical protein